MLSLVHGPVDLVAADAGDPAIAVPINAGAAWVEGWGLALINGNEAVLAHVSGRVVRIGKRDLWSSIGWSHDDQLCLGSRWRRVSFPASADLSEVWAGSGVPVGPLALLADRALTFDGYRVVAHGLSVPSTLTVEHTVFAAVSGGGAIFPADLARQRWWLLSLGTGDVALYDAAVKAEVAGARTSLGTGPIRAAAYSRKLGLFFVVRRATVDQLYVYANEPAASSISAPTFSAAPRAGALRTVRSRVTGAHGEPCAERVVTFSASAGSLDRASVETGADGWAETTYRAPAGAVTGASVTATLVE